ncbi:MAG: FecR domain-containing protein [Treponema sp.]|jgi:hypothetical protein|nr:FecR domain-containing protein [Treponema sp.]
MNKIQKSLIDILVVFLCVSGALGAVYLFWRDLNSTLAKQTEAPVGVVTYKHKAAQRRFSDRLLWSQLQRESPVYNGDLIRTAALSDASITFNDGNSIDLAENCFIQIFFDASGARIELSDGNVSVKAMKSNLTVVSSGTEVRVNSGSLISMGSTASSAVNVQVMEGSAALLTGMKTESMSSGAALTIQSDGETIRDAKVMILSPRPNQRILTFSNDIIPVSFSWGTINFSKDDHVRLEIASDRRFTRLIQTRDVYDSTGTTVELPPGTFFWRVYATNDVIDEELLEDLESLGIDTEGRASTGRVTVLYSAAPQLIGPSMGARYSYRATPSPIRFQWSDTTGMAQEEAPRYILEVADNPAMQTPRLSTTLSGLSLLYSGLEEGTWYWRVTPVYPDDYQGTPPASPLSSFVIQRNAPLSALVLRSPMAESSADIASGSVYFSWDSDSEALSYSLQVSNDESFGTLLLNRNLNDNFFAFQNSALNNGRYYWRVSYIDIEGNHSPMSESRSFIVAQSAPVVTAAAFSSSMPLSRPELEYPRNRIIPSGSDDITFRWKAVSAAETYEFFLYAGSDRPVADDAQIVYQAMIGETALPVPLSYLTEGTYFWTVRALSAAQSSLPAFGQFTIRTPRSVALEYPPESHTFSGVTALRQPGAALWSSAENIGSARFILSQDPELKGTPLRDIPNPSYSVTLPRLTEGTYYWTIRAETVDGIDISAPQIASFQVLPAEAAAVSLAFPDDGHVFTGIEALRAPSSIRWNSTEPVGNARLLLSREADARNEAAVIMDIANPGFAIPMPKLSEGIYAWTIEAETIDGIAISAAKPSRFRVLATEGAAVSLTFPDDGHVFTGIEALRTASSIRWNSTEPVGNARLVLSREADARSEAAVIMDLANPTFNTPMPKLSEGAYSWTVDAETPDRIDISAKRVMRFQVLPLSRVSLDAPQAGYTFNGLDALRRPGTLRWSSREAVGHTRLIISQNPDHTRGIPVLDLRDAGMSVTLPKLKAGTYYWTVQAETEDGIDISPAQSTQFQVLPIPLLAAVQEIQPARGEQIGANLVQQQRSLSFSWNSVSGANAYIFTLASAKAPSAPLVQTKPLTQTAYRLSDMTLLDVGEFIWRVEAVNVDEHGVIDQRGEVSDVRFTIHIPPLSNPRLRVNGTLLGD